MERTKADRKLLRELVRDRTLDKDELLDWICRHIGEDSAKSRDKRKSKEGKAQNFLLKAIFFDS